MLYSKIFKQKYYNILNSIPNRHRGDGFLLIFEYLEQFDHPFIIETGTARPGYTMEGDGQSTILFDEFVYHNNGILYSVDIDSRAAEFAKSKVSKNTSCITADSVKFLWDFGSFKYDVFGRPHLIYLDSSDVNFHDNHPANFHAMKELCSAMRLVTPGMLIAVDDCLFVNGDTRVPPNIQNCMVGKGYYVRQFMENIGAKLIHDGYQLIWKMA